MIPIMTPTLPSLRSDSSLDTPLAYIVPHPHVKSRTSQKVCDSMLTHPLRPPCAAGEWLLLWLTPYGIRDMDACARLLPFHIITRKCLLLSRAVTPKTLSNYSAGLLRFIQFCDNLHIPEELSMPAPEWLLSSFLTFCGTGAVSKGTMQL